MRHAYDPSVAYFKDGMISGLALGSDCCAEHECGTKAMRDQHCGAFIARETRIRRYKETGVKVPYDMSQSQMINKRLEMFVRAGILGANRNDCDVIHNSRADDEFIKRLCTPAAPSLGLRFREKPAPFQAAWDERAFCIWSDDEKFKKKLLKFWDSLLAGKVMFFTRDSPMWRKHISASGIVLVDTTRMAYEDRKVIETQQKEDDFRVELGFKSELEEILDHHKKLFGERWFGYVREERYNAKGEVLYFVNPGYSEKIDYIGPYTKGQLIRWMDNRKSYQLTAASPE